MLSGNDRFGIMGWLFVPATLFYFNLANTNEEITGNFLLYESVVAKVLHLFFITLNFQI
jgi:hypothetical protein